MTSHLAIGNHEKNRDHYDTVVQSWQSLMGDNFHWGHFASPDITLEQATVALIDLLASTVPLTNESRLLDVGCGIGEPARHLHRQFGCHVTGISNSRRGIQRAIQITQECGLDTSVEFFVRDALNCGFAENSFDVVWLMEMSHLISDKQALINEAVHNVKPGGHVALCDLTFRRRPMPSEVFAHLEDHRVLKRAFGEAQLETLDVYQEVFSRAGLLDIKVLDISDTVSPTLQHWKANAMSVMQHVSDAAVIDGLQDFVRSCDILRGFYGDGIWGYGCAVGVKSDRE